MRVVATAAALSVLLGSSGLPAQDNRSLTGFESRPMGQEITVPDSGSDDENFGSGSLEERIVLARASIKALTEALALANSEAEIFKRQAAELQLKLDAYGLAGIDKEPAKIEQRLLAAVRDLRILKKKNEDAMNQLVRLTEAIQVLMKTTDGIHPQARVSVETELRKTREILGAADAPDPAGIDPTLSDGMVVDTKEDLALVVANIGSRHGVKVGMPFQVWRDKERIGDVRVVDVRERISGAVIQNLTNEKNSIKPGDRLRVDAQP
ncbi:MAG: hypothetical protein SFU53_03330 [Terrimicrobiaceae bacterium]|nr:hypothetical protein [Terrimicrobiaceae bacterium]